MPHINYYLGRTSEVFVVHKNRVLLREHDKYGFWLSVGGHDEIDEDSNQAAVREVKEEVGLEIKLYNPNYVEFQNPDYKELVPPMWLNRHRINNSHEHTTSVYLATSTTDKLNITKGHEKSECRWFARGELDDLAYEIPPHIKRYAIKALEILKDFEEE